MEYYRQRDIIDKLLDTIDKKLEFQGFAVSRERTYIGKQAIADRLGCSISKVNDLMSKGKLLYYYVYLGRRRTIRTNETMIRMTYRAWWEASHLSAKPVPAPSAEHTRG